MVFKEIIYIALWNSHVHQFMFDCFLKVTDYTRDLEEMQNVSREDYLASLRRYVHGLKCVCMVWTMCPGSKVTLLLILDVRCRKSSGFSRGISKYRGLSRYLSSTN